jgi:hypothetical protein
VKPTVPDVLPLANAVYARPGGGAGCCLHIVLDDGNIQDDHVAFCLNKARERGHLECIACAEKLLLMSKTQRKKIASSHT